MDPHRRPISPQEVTAAVHSLFNPSETEEQASQNPFTLSHRIAGISSPGEAQSTPVVPLINRSVVTLTDKQKAALQKWKSFSLEQSNRITTLTDAQKEALRQWHLFSEEQRCAILLAELNSKPLPESFVNIDGPNSYQGKALRVWNSFTEEQRQAVLSLTNSLTSFENLLNEETEAEALKAKYAQTRNLKYSEVITACKLAMQGQRDLFTPGQWDALLWEACCFLKDAGDEEIRRDNIILLLETWCIVSTSDRCLKWLQEVGYNAYKFNLHIAKLIVSYRRGFLPEETLACLRTMKASWEEEDLSDFVKELLKDTDAQHLFIGTCLSLDALMPDILKSSEVSFLFAEQGQEYHARYEAAIVAALPQYIQSKRPFFGVLSEFLKSPQEGIRNSILEALLQAPLSDWDASDKQRFFGCFIARNDLSLISPDFYDQLFKHYLAQGELTGMLYLIRRALNKEGEPYMWKLVSEAIDLKEVSPGHYTYDLLTTRYLFLSKEGLGNIFFGRNNTLLNFTPQTFEAFGLPSSYSNELRGKQTASIYLKEGTSFHPSLFLEEFLLDTFSIILRPSIPFVDKVKLTSEWMMFFYKCFKRLPEDLKKLTIEGPSGSEEEQLFKDYMKLVFRAIDFPQTQEETFTVKSALIQRAREIPGLPELPSIVKELSGGIFDVCAANHYRGAATDFQKYLALDAEKLPLRYSLSKNGKILVSHMDGFDNSPTKFYVCESTTGLALLKFSNIKPGATFPIKDKVYCQLTDYKFAALIIEGELASNSLIYDSLNLEGSKLLFVGEASQGCIYVCTIKEKDRKFYTDLKTGTIHGLNPNTGDILFSLEFENATHFATSGGYLTYLEKFYQQESGTWQVILNRINASGEKLAPLSLAQFSDAVAGGYDSFRSVIHEDKLYYTLNLREGAVRVGGYDIITGNALWAPFTLKDKLQTSPKVSPDGKLLLLIGEKITMISLEPNSKSRTLLWQAQNKKARSLASPEYFIRKVIFSPDSQFIYGHYKARGNLDPSRPIYKIDCKTGKTEVYSRPEDQIHSLVGFLPDGKPVVSGYVNANK